MMIHQRYHYPTCYPIPPMKFSLSGFRLSNQKFLSLTLRSMFNCSILSNIWYVRLQLPDPRMMMNSRHSGSATHCVILVLSIMAPFKSTVTFRLVVYVVLFVRNLVRNTVHRDVNKESGYHGPARHRKRRSFGPEAMDSASDSDNRKWPQVVRPLPRPLFSGGSQGVPASSNEPVSRHPRSRTSSASTELSMDNSPSNVSRGVFLAGAAITESPISSPTLSDGQRSFSPAPSPTSPRGALSRPRPVMKSSLLSNGSSSASDLLATDESFSQSRRRWDDLRRHFLPAHPSDQAAHDQPPTASPPASDLPPRPSTPKQFRMPKFGFRQVVEQAQGSVVDQNKRFADDIFNASRAMRAVEPRAQRREREGTLATMATSFNMSFMSSNASLGMASTSASNYLPQSRARSRRPPSLQSETSQSPAAAVTTSLYAIISYHTSLHSNQLHFAKFLPHENEVLSALLVPFMAPRSEVAHSEQLPAMEAFEMTVRTWRAASNEASQIIFVQSVPFLISSLDHRSSSGAAFGAAKLRV
jgi:hypothetical protein